MVNVEVESLEKAGNITKLILSLQNLYGEIASGKIEEIIAITQALGRLLDVRAIEPLGFLLKYHRDVQVKDAAVRALLQFGESPAIIKAFANLTAGHLQGGEAIEGSTQEPCNPRFVRPLLTALSSMNPDVKQLAMAMLATFDRPADFCHEITNTRFAGFGIKRRRDGQGLGRAGTESLASPLHPVDKIY